MVILILKGAALFHHWKMPKRTLARQPTEPLLLILAKNVLKKLATSLLNVKRMKDGLQSWDRAFV